LSPVASPQQLIACIAPSHLMAFEREMSTPPTLYSPVGVWHTLPFVALFSMTHGQT